MAEPNDTPLAEGEEEAACRRGVDITSDQDGGVRKEILREGAGEDGPCTGDTVYVHYVGTLLNGDKFDSSRDRGDRFSFTLGKGQVIRGWDVGVASMKRGELALLICRSEYAYGLDGSPPKIPPNASLMFEVELFEWKGEDLSEAKDGSITRSTVEAGQGYDTPSDGATVEIHLTGRMGDKVFEDRDVTFQLGEGSEEGIVEGIETALQKFKKGEKSKLKIHSNLAYGVTGNIEKGIPPSTDVEYELTLKSLERGKESWELELDEKLEQSEIFKTKGTNFFKAGKFNLAIRYYKRVVEYLSDDVDKESAVKDINLTTVDSDGNTVDEGEADNEADNEAAEETAKKETARALTLASQLNLAMCYLKQADNTAARAACDEAITLNANSDKAYFRRGQAEMNMNNYDGAISDFKRVLEIDPNNKAAKNQITVTNQKIRQEKEREKKLYAGMFEKLAQKDAKVGDTNGIETTETTETTE